MKIGFKVARHNFQSNSSYAIGDRINELGKKGMEKKCDRLSPNLSFHNVRYRRRRSWLI